MKTRHGFISNSSSSSFVIRDSSILSKRQIEAIRDHGIIAKYDAWEIKEEFGTITGFTWMDNFDMEQYLTDIGVPSNAVEFDRE